MSNLLDRKLGTFDRARVAGLKFKEVMLSYFLTQGTVIIGQVAITSLMMRLVYNVSVQGSYALYLFLGILGGLCGESFGLLCGIVFQHEIEALIFGLVYGMDLLLYIGKNDHVSDYF